MTRELWHSSLDRRADLRPVTPLRAQGTRLRDGAFT